MGERGLSTSCLEVSPKESCASRASRCSWSDRLLATTQTSHLGELPPAVIGCRWREKLDGDARSRTTEEKTRAEAANFSKPVVLVVCLRCLACLEPVQPMDGNALRGG